MHEILEILGRLSEVCEHLAYSHTFRSEHDRNRVFAELGEIRARIHAAAAAPVSTPVDQHQDQEQAPREYGGPDGTAA